MHEQLQQVEQIYRLFSNLPLEGLGLHGTSAVNAQKIVEKGFRIKKNLFQNDWMHFFYLHPRENISDIKKSFTALNSRIHFMHSKGMQHCDLKKLIQTPQLVIFVPNLAESEQMPSDNPIERFNEGSPIWIRTKNFDGHNILGICDFSYRKGKLDTLQTLDSINNLLEQCNSQQRVLHVGKTVFITNS